MAETREPLLVPTSSCTSRLLFGTLLALFLCTITLLAALNLVLVKERGLVSSGASILWIILASIALFEVVEESGGPSGFLGRCLGYFLGTELIWFESSESGPVLVYGYEVLGTRFNYLYLPLCALRTIDFYPGQATARMGRDMGDWQVALWYDFIEPVSGLSVNHARANKRRLCSLGALISRDKGTAFLEQLINRVREFQAVHLKLTTDPKGPMKYPRASYDVTYFAPSDPEDSSQLLDLGMKGTGQLPAPKKTARKDSMISS